MEALDFQSGRHLARESTLTGLQVSITHSRLPELYKRGVDSVFRFDGFEVTEHAYLGFLNFALQLSHRLQIFGDVHAIFLVVLFSKKVDYSLVCTNVSVLSWPLEHEQG